MQEAADRTDPDAGWRSNLSFVADIISKLAVPLLTVAATVLGIYVSQTFKQREMDIARENNLQALRNQREQSETSLRSAMFRELVGPLLQNDGGAGKDSTESDLPRAQRLALLAELLTLNFHEHFELGPMLHYVDTLPGQTDDARTRLRSTARRVISRQLAPMLSTADRLPGKDPPYIEIWLDLDVAEAPEVLQACFPKGGPPGSPVGRIDLRCTSRPGDGAAGAPGPLVIKSPDGRDSLQVILRGLSWQDQTVGVFALLLGSGKEAGQATPPIEFTLSSYSLPFSDNTLLPSGNRFGLYVTRIDEVPGVLRVMRLSFVWFPKNFVPPRERPYDLDVDPSVVPAVKR